MNNTSNLNLSLNQGKQNSNPVLMKSGQLNMGKQVYVQIENKNKNFTLKPPPRSFIIKANNRLKIVGSSLNRPEYQNLIGNLINQKMSLTNKT